MKNIEELFSLRKDGLTYKDIANRLSIPIGTVKSYLSRCKLRPKENNKESMVESSNDFSLKNINDLDLVKSKRELVEQVVELLNKIINISDNEITIKVTTTEEKRFCLNCGEELKGSRNKIFCSANCRLKHWRCMKHEQFTSSEN